MPLPSPEAGTNWASSSSSIAKSKQRARFAGGASSEAQAKPDAPAAYAPIAADSIAASAADSSTTSAIYMAYFMTSLQAFFYNHPPSPTRNSSQNLLCACCAAAQACGKYWCSMQRLSKSRQMDGNLCSSAGSKNAHCMIKHR